MTTQSVAPRRTIMTTFTIDEQNTITAFGSAEEAAAVSATPFDSFANPKQLAELVAGWPAERPVAVWNSLPGVAPVKTFKNVPRPLLAVFGSASRKGAPAKTKATKKATVAKNAPKAKTAAKAEEAGPREGSKTAQVVCDAPTQERRYTDDHGQDGLAAAHGPRFHGRRDEKGRIRRRVLQIRQRRAQLPHQSVTSTVSFLARPALPRRAFLASGR